MNNGATAGRPPDFRGAAYPRAAATERSFGKEKMGRGIAPQQAGHLLNPDANCCPGDAKSVEPVRVYSHGAYERVKAGDV